MLLKPILALLIAILFSSPVISQTVGVTVNKDASLDGYTFFSPFSSTNAYMVDNCGNLINQWNRGSRPGLSAYFLENGLLFRTYKVATQGPFTSASNAGGLELVDWDNNVVWSYEINTSEWLSHHDAVLMPNGNILVLTWQLVYRDELIALGRDPNEISPENFMWSEKIIELEPMGSNDANIVWEWNIYDHYIQDFDESKEGFGVVADHPELFDINLPEINSSNSNSSRDWNHFNAIDYNENLDQILVSVRNSDEIWILDHSTTTEEAASHSGGIYGKGGDILYRWGNGSAYRRAEVSEQKLFGQHGVNWIDEGMDGEGKILIYNNGNGRPGIDFSTAEIIDPPQDNPGFYTLPEENAFGPQEPEWSYGYGIGEEFYSPYLSNAQRLQNGNVLINAGSIGTVFEIDEYRDKVWEYIIPLNGDSPVNQGQTAFNNATFRAYKYTVDYEGFDGIDLSPGLPIESNPLECQVTTGIENIEESDPIYVYFDPINQSIVIKGLDSDVKVKLIDYNGRFISSHILDKNSNFMSIPNLKPGLFILNMYVDGKNGINRKVFVY